MSDIMNFDDSIEPKSFPFRTGGKDYLVKEANGEAVIAYRKSILRSAKRGKDGSLNVGADLPDGEIQLIADCVFSQEDGKEKKIGKATVLAWPSRVLSWVFSKVKEISDLGDKSTTPEDKEKAEEFLKNELNYTKNGES